MQAQAYMRSTSACVLQQLLTRRCACRLPMAGPVLLLGSHLGEDTQRSTKPGLHVLAGRQPSCGDSFCPAAGGSDLVHARGGIQELTMARHAWLPEQKGLVQAPGRHSMQLAHPFLFMRSWPAPATWLPAVPCCSVNRIICQRCPHQPS